MKWGPGFWTGLLTFGACALAAGQEVRYERGEQLAKRLILTAASGDRRLFDRLLQPIMPEVEPALLDSTWEWARRAAKQVEDYKEGNSSDFTQFVSFKEWCVSLY